MQKAFPPRSLQLIETMSRKAQTLFSLAHSAVLLWKDGIDPRSIDRSEWKSYLGLRPFLNWKPSIVVYDIGANVGAFTRLVARAPNVTTIYAFEPLSSVFVQLKKNTNSLPQVQCFELALGDTTKAQTMYVNESSPSSSILALEHAHVEAFPFAQGTNTVEIQMMTLDDVVRRFELLPPDFIKVDVQGFEDRVIQGGRELVQKAKYCMLELSLISLYKKGVTITDMNALMRSLGFRLVSIVHNVIGESGEIVQVDGLYRNDALHR